MKKILFIAVLSAFSLTATAQTSFGALGGLSLATPAGDFDDDSETGFHIGAFAEISISEKFEAQPELTYTSAGDFTLISLNAIAKYLVSEEFNIQLGPQIGFAGGDFGDLLDDLDDAGADTSKLNLAIALGAGYDINEDIFVQARYGLQLNNHVSESGFDAQVNTFTLGVGYKF